MDSNVVILPADVAAYGNRELRIDDYTLDDIGLEKHCPLDDGHLAVSDTERPRKRQKRHRREHDASSLLPRGGDSALETLPMEILSMILVLLDVPTIVTIRRTSRRIMAAIGALHPYRMLRTHCPDVLRAAVGLGARAYDLATLYETLRTAVCAACGGGKENGSDSGSGHVLPERLAGYLYLITCKRLCYFCYTRHV